GIQWFMMTDGDQEGDKYINRANNHLEHDENLPDRARKLAHLNIEHEFWYGGYDQFITDMVTTARQKQSDKYDLAKKTKSIIEAAIEQAGGKPAFAQALAKEIQ